MAFQVGFSKEDLTITPVPTGIYELRVVKFRPKISAKGNSLNYNLESEVVNMNDDLDSKRVFHPLNTLFSIAIWDFVHACGLEMEKVEVVEDGVPKEILVLPGIFENADANPDDPSQWGDYKGPLTNKVFRADVVETSFQGKPKNEIRAFLCALPNCETLHPDVKHSTNLIKKSDK